MSRRSTRSTSGVGLPQKAVAEEVPSPLATPRTKNGGLKRKERSIVETRSEQPPKGSKRSKKLSQSNQALQNESGAFSPSSKDSPDYTHSQELSVSVTKKVVSTKTKKGGISAAATKGKKVAEATRKVASETEHTKEALKEEENLEEPIPKKRNPTKGKKRKENASEEMPLAARTTGLKMFIGAHVSAAQGIHNAVTNSVHIGGNAFALFLKSQRKWDNPPLQEDHRVQFRRLCVEHKYDASKYVLPHGSYLVNLAQEDPAKAKQAYDSFLDDLKRCEEVGIKLYNFHPGATNNTTLESSLTRIANALVKSLKVTKTVIPVLETTCGHGTTIGATISEFRSLLDLIPREHRDRIGICLDTCHTFAAGYDLRSPKSFKDFMDEFDREIGINHLKALHINDSKTPLGSKRDLHANIGTGFLGLRAFHNVMNEPRLEGLPMILETPIDRAVADDDDPKTKAAANKKQKPSSKPKTVEDKSIWAREIKLLESLIGMDVEGEVFRELEKKLAEEGGSERENQLEVHERKTREREEAERKKSLKAKGKGTGKGKGKAKMKEEDVSEESALSSPPSSPA